MSDDVFEFTTYRGELCTRSISTNQETKDRLLRRGLTTDHLIEALDSGTLGDVCGYWMRTRSAFQPDAKDGYQANKVINFLCWRVIGITYCYVIYADEAFVFEVEDDMVEDFCAYCITQNRFIDVRRPGQIISYFRYDACGDPINILAEDVTNDHSFAEWKNGIEKMQMIGMVDNEATTPPLHRNKKEHGYEHIMAK
jgi:hypothetical protein